MAALNLLIVSSLVGWRLWVMRLRGESGRWLFVFFGASLALSLLWILAATRLDIWHFIALHSWGLIWTAGSVCLIQYAYRLGEIDPQFKEARAALVVSLTALALASIWAGFQIYQLAPGGRPTMNTRPVDSLAFVGFGWVLVVMLRQAYSNWSQAKSFSVISHLVVPLLGSFLLVAAGVISIISLLSGRLVVVDFGRVFLVAVALNFIGFNYLIYWDSIGPRITRLVGAALLLIQTVFTYLGLIYTMQASDQQLAALPVISPDSVFTPFTPAEIVARQQLHDWTAPIFAFQLLMSFLAIGLLIYSGWRMRTTDRFLENMSISTRQREIIALLAQGYNNPEIARELVISENTVKYHLRGVYKTLDISDRDALARWYRDRLADEYTTQ